MLKTLKCPSCAAPLEYDEEKDGAAVRCPFCGNTMYAPEARRRKLDVPPPPTRKRSGLRGFLAVAIIMCGVVALAFISLYRRKPDPATPVRPSPIADVFKAAGIKTPAPPTMNFATVALKFGEEGTGPGRFTDARSIAVDGEGRIYVGDYTGGRIQVFDASGKFLTQWMVDRQMPLRGLAADRAGTVYVVQSGKILRYEGTSGKLLGEVSYPEGEGFDDVAATADGGLVAAWRIHRDDIVRFSSSGKPLKVIRSAISGQTDRSELLFRVAADGLDNIYSLGVFNNAVFKFTPEGRYVTRFGSDGDQPGQFRAPSAIAVDGRGRVYVSDIKGIQVFDGNGRYLDVFKPASIAFGMVFNDRDELFIAARTQVLKLTLNNK